jgi:3-oxosteroid 1-dehydrogenase
LAFLENGPKMAKWLEDEGFRWTLAHEYPDYFPEVPGGRPAGGRTIEPKVFDIKKLGDWKELVERSPVRANVPVYSYEGARLIRAKTGWDGWMTALRVLSLRWPWEKLMGREPVTLGQSLVAQLLHLCLKKEIPIWRSSPLKDVVIEDGQVKGAVVLKNNDQETTIPTKNLILAAGGFASNPQLRSKYQSLPSSYTNASPHDTGDALTLTLKHNLATTLLDDSWWGPTTIDPATGRTYWCQFERSLPHSIIVDKKGERFTNESKNYNAVGHDIIARNKAEPGSAIPAFLIMDARHRSRYVLAAKFLPGITPQSAIDSGFIVKAPTLRELAGQLGVDAAGLEKTVKRFNDFAVTGVDEDFHRGESAYDRYFGDTTSGYRKNLNLGSVAQAPFYAVKVWPGDLGTKGGVVTDEHSRALKEVEGELKPVEGLYAVGNSSASVMGRTYAGAGATLGPAMSFAFVAADHISQKS